MNLIQCSFYNYRGYPSNQIPWNKWNRQIPKLCKYRYSNVQYSAIVLKTSIQMAFWKNSLLSGKNMVSR